MRTLFLMTLGLLIGYFAFPLLNPAPDYRPGSELLSIFEKFLNAEARNYADADTVEEKLKAADAMYEKMMVLFLANLGLQGQANKTVKVDVHITHSREAPKPVPSHPTPSPHKPSPKKKNETVAEKIQNNTLDLKTALTFKNFSYLSAGDSRILKLLGKFTGEFKSKGLSRIDPIQKATLEMRAKPEKVSFQVVDSFDNVDELFTFQQDTLSRFKSVPGDENLLMLELEPNMSYMILDIRAYPLIAGKYYNLHFLKANFHLKKSP